MVESRRGCISLDPDHTPSTNVYNQNYGEKQKFRIREWSKTGVSFVWQQPNQNGNKLTNSYFKVPFSSSITLASEKVWLWNFEFVPTFQYRTFMVCETFPLTCTHSITHRGQVTAGAEVKAQSLIFRTPALCKIINSYIHHYQCGQN